MLEVQVDVVVQKGGGVLVSEQVYAEQSGLVETSATVDYKAGWGRPDSYPVDQMLSEDVVQTACKVVSERGRVEASTSKSDRRVRKRDGIEQSFDKFSPYREG